MRRIFLVFVILSLVFPCWARKQPEGKGMWVHPGDLGKSDEEVRDFFLKLKKCNINIVFPLVKGTGGMIYWHSKKFPSAVAPDYREFDLLESATKYARKYGIKIHAWLCDFPESKSSPAFIEHPEWAMLNPDGGLTSDEKLSGDRPYDSVWMCPAQRPGYVDQWLIPMIEEIIENYKVDGIHHDYVRYPGDVAPDSYCFCDYCLEYYLKHNHFYYSSRPDDQISLKIVLPRVEANWHNDLTLKPKNWSEMSRREKAAYLVDGKTINRPDMDYFFYETRSDVITRFVREVTERARRIKPKIEISAAVFINPMRSGRYIGQRWTDFTSWVDHIIPMDYRSHFQGSFEDYLAYLEDYIRAQKEWCAGKSRLYIGVTGHYIYREERDPWERAIEILQGEEGGKAQEEELKQLMTKNIAYLIKVSSEKAAELSTRIESFFEGKLQREEFLSDLRNILSDPPQGFFPEEKLMKTIETIRKAAADGVVIFAGGIINRNKLWPALEKAFSK